ncbi:unnamed protein product [Heligmosomoides polygyrus]|uniref:Uncharacterized protein n=1 Tax=Heligmosomoides polygyrus TaxID=6339 RepID=A0A183FM64_HELPZ|nr:unnamed protein product [Heligmosomoides polygyrus]
MGVSLRIHGFTGFKPVDVGGHSHELRAFCTLAAVSSDASSGGDDVAGVAARLSACPYRGREGGKGNYPLTAEYLSHNRNPISASRLRILR